MKTLIIACLMLGGCIIDGDGRSAVNGLKNRLTYFKDDRTNICFAGLELGFTSQTITIVPCNEEVEKLLIK